MFSIGQLQLMLDQHDYDDAGTTPARGYQIATCTGPLHTRRLDPHFKMITSDFCIC